MECLLVLFSCRFLIELSLAEFVRGLFVFVMAGCERRCACWTSSCTTLLGIHLTIDIPLNESQVQLSVLIKCTKNASCTVFESNNMQQSTKEHSCEIGLAACVGFGYFTVHRSSRGMIHFTYQAHEVRQSKKGWKKASQTI